MIDASNVPFQTLVMSVLSSYDERADFAPPSQSTAIAVAMRFSRNALALLVRGPMRATVSAYFKRKVPRARANAPGLAPGGTPDA